MQRKIGFIGIGNMGKGICHNLINASNDMSVYDLSYDAMKFFEGRAYLASDVKNVVNRSDVIFLSLPNSNIVESVIDIFIDEGIVGKLIVDISTSDPLSTKKLYEKIKKAGGNLLDSPLIAGPQEAMDGTLDIVVAGDKEVVDSYADMFASYCRHYEYVGESGKGHLMKLAQNWAGLLQAIMYAQLYPVMAKHGIEPDILFKVLSTDFFDNWFFRFYSKKYVNKNYLMDFALELGLKDLTYMKKLCDDVGVPGFMLDGAIDLCRVSLKEGKDRGIKQDMSHVADTMYQYVGY